MTFLVQPYPFEFNFKKDLLSHFMVGLFIALFFIIFQPFGTWQWENPYKIFHFLMFGCISFSVSFLSNLIFRILFKKLEYQWIAWKEIVFILGFVLLVILSNFLYAYLIGVISFSSSSFIKFIFYSFFIAAIPVNISVHSIYKKYKEAHQKDAEIINKELDTMPEKEVTTNAETPNENITFIAENGKDSLTIAANSILYIQSLDNYSEIFYLKDGQIKKTLIRSSLKRLESQNACSHLIRCHRSTIVNLKKVKQIAGNAQGYKLSFFDSNDIVSVSRNFSSAVLSGIKVLKA